MLRRFSLILIKYITCGIGWNKSIAKKFTNFPNDWIFAQATPLPVFQKVLGKKEEKGTGIHINFRWIHDLFVVCLISSQVYIKTPSVSGSRNRRQVKPRNKNRHSSWLFSFLLVLLLASARPVSQPRKRDSVNNMAWCLMSRSITAPCQFSSWNVALYARDRACLQPRAKVLL